jgi:hypothetical protein
MGDWRGRTLKLVRLFGETPIVSGQKYAAELGKCKVRAKARTWGRGLCCTCPVGLVGRLSIHRALFSKLPSGQPSNWYTVRSQRMSTSTFVARISLVNWLRVLIVSLRYLYAEYRVVQAQKN